MLVWAHGLWGSPNGSKITAIRESGIEVIAPDFNEMELKKLFQAWKRKEGIESIDLSVKCLDEN